MQNFKKYGVAVAVASVATGAMAQRVSTVDAGDAAIIPYYTAEGGRITGIHVVNTTAATQAVKVRLRRGSDSSDAMDFNIVMSPKDEWTAYIAKDEDGVYVGTSDTTCTVPMRLAVEGIGRMPATFADGGSEGYVEIIGMGETAVTSIVGKASKHKDGVPADCATVEKNFLRILDDDLRYGATTGTAAEQANAAVGGTAGVHTNALTSTGTCAKSVTTTSVGACTGTTTAVAANATSWSDTSDRALKVSYWIREGATDGEGAAEVGANAVHIEGFTDAFAAASNTNGAVMTNQVRLTFDANTVPPNRLLWDPQNFEFPNLGQAYGNSGSPVLQPHPSTATTNDEAGNQAHFDAIRRALDVDQLVNEWADNDKADADWIVTLPGQYAMRDGVCLRYAVEGPQTACADYTATTTHLTTDALKTDDDQLPLYLVDGSGSYVSGVYAFSNWDREEGVPAATTSSSAPQIDFSPSSNDTEGYETVYLRREVNVVAWGSDDGTSVGSAAKQSAEADTHGLVQVIGTGELTEGWATLDLVSTNATPQPAFVGTSNKSGAALPLAVRASAGTTAKPGQANYLAWGTADANDIPAVGLAVWKREFADNASGNYGRAIEHSIVVSSGSCGYMNNGTMTNGANSDGSAIARTTAAGACDRG